MKKIVQVFFVLMLLITPAFEGATSVDLSAKRVRSSSLGSTKTRSSNSTIRTKNNYAKSKAKQQATNGYGTKQRTTTRSRTRGVGSFLGGMFLGSFLFGRGSFMSGIINLLFIFFVIRFIIGLITKRKAKKQFNQAGQYQTNNPFDQTGQSRATNQQNYASDLTPLFNELDELVEMANQRDIDVSDILNDDRLTIHEKLNMIRNILR